MAKTIAEINQKIKKGKAVVVTKEEFLEIIKDKGRKATTNYVDVVTTGTFGPMCSSMALFNIGSVKPRMKIQKASLNDVPCYCGLAAVDMLIGASEIADNDPANANYPGEFNCGGAHIIEALVSGKDVRLKASAYGTDTYPRKSLEQLINLKNMNSAWLLNPRNCYQNYSAAVNLSKKTIYTYMGMLRPQMANINYCSAGQLSPLLNDPYFRTIGIGTRIFLGGGTGYIFSQGTQYNMDVPRQKSGLPIEPAGTLAVQGDLKTMSAEWLRAASVLGYGVSLAVGIGVPIPVIDQQMVDCIAVRDQDIYTNVFDYSRLDAEKSSYLVGKVNYKDLKTGRIVLKGKTIPSAGLSSYFKAREICEILKTRIQQNKFQLTEPVEKL
ncbi:MAG: hypothetical protein DRP78_02375 [Candidatus Omnitrophota bacterium]|nr:MAG: hypothetical protein DRP78_02375 [Candidatus Omnitrophota bacterium]